MSNLVNSLRGLRGQRLVTVLFEISVVLTVVPLLVHGFVAVSALPVA